MPPINWTGFYVGGVLGAAAGRTDIGFVGAPTAGNRPWVLGGLGRHGARLQLSVHQQLGAGRRRRRRAPPIFMARGQPVPPMALTANGASVAFSPLSIPPKTRRTGWQRRRLGWVTHLDRTLFYAKGGAAFEDSSTTVTAFTDRPVSRTGRSCLNQAGVVTPGFQHSQLHARRLDAGLRHRVRPRQELVGQGRVRLPLLRRPHARWRPTARLS